MMLEKSGKAEGQAIPKYLLNPETIAAMCGEQMGVSPLHVELISDKQAILEFFKGEDVLLVASVTVI